MQKTLHIQADENGEVILLLKCGTRNVECGIKSRDELLGAITKLLKSARVPPYQLDRIDLDVAHASFSFSRAAWAIAKTFELVHGVKVGAKGPAYYGKPNITKPHAK